MHIRDIYKATYSPVGVDVGSRSVNAIQLVYNQDHMDVHEADIAMLPEEGKFDPEILKEIIHDLFRRNSFKGKDVVSRMPSFQVNIIPVKISLREGERLDQAIIREAREYIPYPLEEAVIDYLPVSNNSPDASNIKKILLIFSKRSDVISYLNIFKSIGLKVQAIDVGPNALNRAIRRFKDPSEQQVMTINVGRAYSFSTILWNDSILIDRKMGWGENRLIDRMVSNLDIEPKEARDILYKYGIDCSNITRVVVDETSMTMVDEVIPSYIFEILFPVLEELNREIEKMLVYCTSEMKGAMIDKIYLLGNGSLLRHLNHYIHRSTGITATIFKPEEIFNNAEKLKKIVIDNFPVFIIAIGLALRSHNNGGI